MTQQTHYSRRRCTISTAGGGYTYLSWTHPNSDTWDEVRLRLRSDFIATYQAEHRRWRVQARVQDLARWAGAFFTPDEITTDTAEQYRTPAPLEDAYRTLFLLPTAPRELVDSAHRVLARINHPDTGGSHDQAVAINNAYDVIRAVRR